MSDDFSGKQINDDADCIKVIIDAGIGHIADPNDIGRSLIKFLHHTIPTETITAVGRIEATKFPLFAFLPPLFHQTTDVLVRNLKSPLHEFDPDLIGPETLFARLEQFPDLRTQYFIVPFIALYRFSAKKIIVKGSPLYLKCTA